MRQKSQLNLRIVGRKQRHPRTCGKRRANLPAQLRAHGNILQIGLGRAEPAGRCARLAQAGVQPPGGRIDQLRQCVHVRGFQLGDFAELQNLARQLVHQRHRFKNIGGRRAGFASAARRRPQAHLVKENFRELRGRIDVEFHFRDFPDRAFDAANFLFHRGRHRTRALPDRRARRHIPSARSRRPEAGPSLRKVVQSQVFHLLAQHRREPLKRIRPLAGNTGEGCIQVARHHVRVLVIRRRRAHQIGIKHRRVTDPGDGTQQHLHDFRIVNDLGPRRIGKPGTQFRQNRLCAGLIHSRAAAIGLGRE